MNKELIALLDGKETGRVVRDKSGKLTFTYNEQWRNATDAYPLSLSMPITLAEHTNAKIDPFLWGLLPDNEIFLSNWARKFHVSARNVFSLIACVGEDCAGAVQLVQPARLDAILGAEPPPIGVPRAGRLTHRLTQFHGFRTLILFISVVYNKSWGT